MFLKVNIISHIHIINKIQQDNMKARALHKSLLLVNVILACQNLDITYKLDKVKITTSTFSNVIDNIPAAKNNTGASKRFTKC